MVKAGFRKGGAVNCCDIEGLNIERSGGRGKDCCLKGLLCLAAKGFGPNTEGAVCEPMGGVAVLASRLDNEDLC